MPDDARPAARFARSAGFWLRAYPRRWRAARAAEMTEVLADLAEPGATRLDLRDAVDVVRHGWATRWREHPPLPAYLAYRIWGGRVQHRYDPWLWDDLNGGLSPWRGAVPALFVAGFLGINTEPRVALGFLVVWGVVGYATRGSRRRVALQRYFTPASPGVRVVPHPPVLGPHGFRYLPPTRTAARPVLGATALIGLTAAGAMLLASRFCAPGNHGPSYEVLGVTLTLPLAQYGFPTALQAALGAVAVVLTVPAAAGILVGLSRRAAGRPAQPHRVLLGEGLIARLVVAGTVVWNLVVALLIATDTGLDFTVGVPTTVLGSLLGPAALVGWLLVRRAERDGGAPLALVDVAHLVGRRRRRPLEVDQLVAVWTWPDPYALPVAPPGRTTPA